MTDSLQCPKCSGIQISQQLRHRNPKNGNSVGGWFPGCLLQLVLLSALATVGGLLIRMYWPTHPFAEAALLTATIALIYTVGVGIFALWVRRWPLVNEFTCGDCGYHWYAELPSKQQGAPPVNAEKPTG